METTLYTGMRLLLIEVSRKSQAWLRIPEVELRLVVLIRRREALYACGPGRLVLLCSLLGEAGASRTSSSSFLGRNMCHTYMHMNG